MRARRAIALGVSGVLAAQWAPAAAVASRRAARFLDVCTTFSSTRGILLTFDDGPHPSGTPAVLAALERERAPAVFFVSGEQVSRHPGLVSEIVAAGHEIALHGYRHQTRRQWSHALLIRDTLRAVDAVSRAAATMPRLYRPPHGVFTLTGLRSIRSLGLAPVLWSKWGRDWERGATASAIARRATDAIEAGDIVLLHDADYYGAPDSWKATAASLASIMDRVRALGLQPVPAAQTLLMTD